MIPLVETEARSDPRFAKLPGGVWKNRMADEVWSRLQAVWDLRRGAVSPKKTSPPTLRIVLG
jgi:hypothetical protein